MNLESNRLCSNNADHSIRALIARDIFLSFFFNFISIERIRNEEDSGIIKERGGRKSRIGMRMFRWGVKRFWFSHASKECVRFNGSKLDVA